MKSISPTQLLALGVTLVSSVSFAEGAADRKAVVETQSSRLSELLRDGTQKSGIEASGGASSDVGLQQLVDEKETGIGVEAGVSTSYLFRSNPLSTNGEMSTHIKSPVVDATGFVSLSLGAYDVWGGVFVPRLGLSYYVLEHTKSILRFADFSSTKVSFLGDLKYSSGWTITPGIEYSNIVNSKADTEDYREYYPNITVSKVWSLDSKSALRALINTGYHFSNVDDLGGTLPEVTEDRLNNWPVSVGVAYSRSLFAGLQFIGYGEISRKSFSNGTNQDRCDWSRSVGSSLSYALISRKWFTWRISVFGNYINRASNDVSYKYTNYDVGASTGVSVNF